MYRYCRHCRLEGQYSWGQYINYLHRQLYVLDTYVTAHNKKINQTLMVLHSWASWAFALPCLTGV